MWRRDICHDPKSYDKRDFNDRFLYCACVDGESYRDRFKKKINYKILTFELIIE